MHLVLSCFGGNKESLWDDRSVDTLLRVLVKRIGMTEIPGTHVVKTIRPAKSQDGGVSGMVMIEESHIAIHTFPVVGEAMVEIASCKDWRDRKDETVAYVMDFYGFERVHVEDVQVLITLPSARGILA